MKKILLLPALLILAALAAGCGSIGNLYTYQGRGMLFTHRVEPLTHHYRPIQVAKADQNASGETEELQFRYISVVWGNNAIGEIAKKAGLQTLHYADLERTSILFGLWSRNVVRLYGTAPAGIPNSGGPPTLP